MLSQPSRVVTKCVGEASLEIRSGVDPRTDQLAQLLDHSGSYRLLFEFLAYTGLRIGEALGLTWADIDHDNGLIHEPRRLKTEAGRRDGDPRPSFGKGAS